MCDISQEASAFITPLAPDLYALASVVLSVWTYSTILLRI
jgi:hypothetical protein